MQLVRKDKGSAMIVDPHAPIIKQASFRFFEELNDFFPIQLRKRLFYYEFSGNPAIKDSIEALGVPHTEIDLIIVDGKSVGFEYRLEGGEHVSVYPVFESLDISPIVRLRPKPLRQIKFVVDVNLGKIVPKLRLLGFDTLYKNDLKDDEIVEIAQSQQRIILTRDRGIFKYSAVTHGYWVRSDQPKTQLRELINRLQLVSNFKPFTRCVNCNGLLHQVDKCQVQDCLPRKIQLSFDRFMQCEQCHKIYWCGSHYKRIQQWINTLKDDLVSGTSDR